MSVESDVDPRTPGVGRPGGCGGLTTVFAAGPMFRRTLTGYDRFQVDSYVRWAEDELTTAEHENEHLLARQLRTSADLEQARALLAHSAGGGEFLRLSDRLGSMLAAAADEAEGMRSEAAALRAAATAEAARALADADQLRGEATADAVRVRGAAAAEADRLIGEAAERGAETTAAARRIETAARAEATARLEEVARAEQRAADDAARVRQQAAAAAATARLQARDDVVRMHATGREERRRADDAAAAARRRLDEEQSAQQASLRAEVAALQQRCGELRAEAAALADQVPGPAGRPLDRSRHRLLARLSSVRTP